MGQVVVTGAAGVLGRRVVERLLDDPEVDRVLALDRAGQPAPTSLRVEPRRVDLVADDLKPLLHEADAVIHLASVFGPALDDAPEVAGGREVEIARRVLAACADDAVPTVVLLSTAAVYGAWPNNPIPLTEDAPLRPNPGCTFAVQRAEVERLAAEWALDQPDARLVLLRPAPMVADGQPGWLARALVSAPAPVGADEPPAQTVHVDDVARAVEVAWRSDLRGPVNVAPDGWLSGEEAKALAAGMPKLRTPARLANRLARFRWRFRLAPTPPGIVPYRWQPWVVANDKLRAAGWAPQRANDDAFVSGHEAGPLATLSPRRRQELALGVAGGALAAGTAATAAVLLRRRRR